MSNRQTAEAAEAAVTAANDFVARGALLNLIDEAEAQFPAEAGAALNIARKAALGAQRAAWVVDQVLDRIRIGNPLLRALAGLVVGVLYLVVSIFYQLHRACLRRRRRQRLIGGPIPPPPPVLYDGARRRRE